MSATSFRLRRFWLAAAVGLALVAALVWWISGSTAATTRPGRDMPVAVSVVSATTGPLDVTLSALGTVIPRNTVTVHTQTDGQLMKLYFDEGQAVKAGDPLADLDDRPAKATLAQAQGQLAKDTALLATAKIDLQRYQTLLAQDSISRQQVDAQASLVKQYEGAIQADAGQVAAATVQVTYSHIKAPVSGRVGLRQVDPGNVVHAGDANGLVVITELDPITALFTIPQDSITQVDAAMAASGTLPVEAWDRTNRVKLAEGKLLAVDNQVDVTTGTIKLKAEFANPDGALFPNQFVNIRLMLEHRDDQIFVPATALQHGPSGTYVYVLAASPTTSAKGKVSPWVVNSRVVAVGPAVGDSVSILTGLAAGEPVVTDGTDRLRDNARVLLPTAAASSTAPHKARASHGQAS